MVHNIRNSHPPNNYKHRCFANAERNYTFTICIINDYLSIFFNIHIMQYQNITKNTYYENA